MLRFIVTVAGVCGLAKEVCGHIYRVVGGSDIYAATTLHVQRRRIYWRILSPGPDRLDEWVQLDK